MSPSQHMTEIKGIQIKKDGRTLWNGFYCRQMVLKKILNQIQIKKEHITNIYKDCKETFTPVVGSGLSSEHREVFCPSSARSRITYMFDVIKTTFMNAKPGEFSGIGGAFLSIVKQGPLAFYKGFIPALIRVSPNTIITFILYEQARLRFGYLPPDAK